MATFAQLEAWCSSPRLAGFLLNAGGDQDMAVRLYQWNAELSGAFMEVLHHVEVVLRNHLDKTLTQAFPAAPEPWYRSDAVLTPQGRAKVEQATQRIIDQGIEPNHGRIIAALGFGFWDSLFGRRYGELWPAVLRDSFPHGPAKRGRAAELSSGIRLFRNKLAHHERIIHLNLTNRHSELLQIVAWIDPAARAWIAEGSQVLTLLEARPD